MRGDGSTGSLKIGLRRCQLQSTFETRNFLRFRLGHLQRQILSWKNQTSKETKKGIFYVLMTRKSGLTSVETPQIWREPFESPTARRLPSVDQETLLFATYSPGDASGLGVRKAGTCKFVGHELLANFTLGIPASFIIIIILRERAGETEGTWPTIQSPARLHRSTTPVPLALAKKYGFKGCL